MRIFEWTTWMNPQSHGTAPVLPLLDVKKVNLVSSYNVPINCFAPSLPDLPMYALTNKIHPWTARSLAQGYGSNNGGRFGKTGFLAILQTQDNPRLTV